MKITNLKLTVLVSLSLFLPLSGLTIFLKPVNATQPSLQVETVNSKVQLLEGQQNFNPDQIPTFDFVIEDKGRINKLLSGMSRFVSGVIGKETSAPTNDVVAVF